MRQETFQFLDLLHLILEVWQSMTITHTWRHRQWLSHYNDVIMGTLASQITSLTFVYWIVYSDADQRKHQSSASLAFVLGMHRGPVNSPHKRPVTRKMFPFDDVIMLCTHLKAGKWKCFCILIEISMSWFEDKYPLWFFKQNNEYYEIIENL